MVIYGMSENIFVFSPLFFSFPSLHIPRSPKGNGNQKKERKEMASARPTFGAFFAILVQDGRKGKDMSCPLPRTLPPPASQPLPSLSAPSLAPSRDSSPLPLDLEPRKTERGRGEEEPCFFPWGRVNLEDRASQRRRRRNGGGQSKEQSEKVVLMARGDKLSPTVV